LLLLHGLGNDYRSWTYVLRALDYEKQRVIALDLLGFGKAPKPKGDYTARDHADAVIATLDQLHVEKAVVTGHSMGCIVAVEIAKQRPELVERLVLLGAPLYKTMPRGSLFARLTRREGAYFAIFTALKKNPDITIASAKGVDATLPLLKGLKITESTWPAFRASLTNTVMQVVSYKDVKALQVPTLLVYGLLDFFVIKRNLKDLARSNKQFVRLKTTLGPHEITPLQGRVIAKLLQS
jgi:pimeloyl-ACP methyl ester carboxylesterase